MPLSALLLVLAAAFLHASWNLLLAGARDSESAMAVAAVVAVVAFAPVSALVWRADSSVWPYVLGSGGFHLVYFVLLAAAYHRAELSVVYPLARGTAPVLVLVVGVAALGASSSPVQALGVLLVAAGVLLVRGFRPAEGSGVGFGLAIAFVIAGYTLVDNGGVERANPITYLELSMLLPTAAYAAAVGAAKGVVALRAELNVSTVAAGFGIFGAYALVLAALARAPAAPVAAVREVSILLAAALARIVLRESVGPVRFGGAALVVGGVVLVSV